jgi:hypothetical protein
VAGPRYFDYSTFFHVASGETITLDIQLFPYPEEDSTISGTVTDAGTGEPLGSVSVDLTIFIEGHSYSAWAQTDSNGQYSVPVPASTVRMEFDYYYWDYGGDGEYDDGADNGNGSSGGGEGAKPDEGGTRDEPPMTAMRARMGARAGACPWRNPSAGPAPISAR